MAKNMKKKFTLFIYSILIANLLWGQGLPNSENKVELSFPCKVSTYTSIVTQLGISAQVYDAEYSISSFTWDIYSDGKTLLNTSVSKCSYRYATAGIFKTTVTANLQNGLSRSLTFTVEVTSGSGVQIISPVEPMSLLGGSSSLKSYNFRPKNGIVDKYAVLVSGAVKADAIHPAQSQTVKEWNTILKDQYGYKRENIYYHEIDKSVAPDDVDSEPTLLNIKNSFDAIRDKIDEDDILFVWIADHGYGYKDPAFFLQSLPPSEFVLEATNRTRNGEISTRLIENGSEIIESNIQFGVQAVNFPGSLSSTRFPGLNKWILIQSSPPQNTDKSGYFYRIKFVADADADEYIEVVADYLTIDTDRDGRFVSSEYAKYSPDFDVNGNELKAVQSVDADNVITSFDEADWQNNPKIIKDNYHPHIDLSSQHWLSFVENNMAVTKTYVMFDRNFDNKLDIDLINTPWPDISKINSKDLQVNGTDNNNDGIIDGLDLNDDGDQTDKWDIDEHVNLLSIEAEPIYSTELNQLLNSLSCKNSIIGIEACFSGGFIRHLSAPGRVILTITQDRYWGFSEDGKNFTSGFSTTNNFMNADANKNGTVTILELFNYAYSKDKTDLLSLPQYNDNGDGKMYKGTISTSANAGCLGNLMTLNGYIPNTSSVSNKTISTVNDYSGTSISLNSVKITSAGSLNLHQMTAVPGIISLNGLIIETGGRLVIDNSFCK